MEETVTSARCPLGEIQADIRAAEREIVSLLREVAG